MNQQFLVHDSSLLVNLNIPNLKSDNGGTTDDEEQKERKHIKLRKNKSGDTKFHMHQPTGGFS
jgi:hypothetical protein